MCGEITFGQQEAKSEIVRMSALRIQSSRMIIIGMIMQCGDYRQGR